MKKTAIVAGMLIFLALTFAVGLRIIKQDVAPVQPAAEPGRGFLYGKVTAVDGSVYQGRLRWGGDEEAFWSDYFNGFKDGNRWAAYVPPERRRESSPVEFFGLEVGRREREIDLGRPFMARFGDIARIEGSFDEVRVILKSGTVFDLDRFEAGDFDDGVRVWDNRHGVVDLGSRKIRTIEFLPGPDHDADLYRLHGTVRTDRGDFTGFLQWNREAGVGTDELGVRFETIRSIVRRDPDGSLVTLHDGREIELSDTAGRGIYVDDLRYGRVLVSWDAFRRVDFSDGGSGPTYDDFPPGLPLAGSVSTRAAERFTGRLVYDLDESETTETLDAPFQGVDYTIPFGLVGSIVLPGGEEEKEYARVILHNGEELQLGLAGDLGEGNAGLLIFMEDGEVPEYVSWADVQQIDLLR
jgi:hypothetical protein